MDDIPKHKKLRRPKQKPACLATLQLPPCWPELGLKLPSLLFSDRKLLLSDRKLLFSEVHKPLQNLVPKLPRCPEPSRKSKAPRKAAGAEKETGANKGPLPESWRVVEEAGAAYRSALADELAGLGRVVTGGAKMHPIPQTSYCVLPAIKSSSRPVEPIRASASETLGALGCRASPDGRESTYSSLPPPLPPSLPLSPCRPEAQSPGSSPPPTLNDPVTRETTPSLLSLEETGDELSVLEAMMSHPHWKIINRVLFRKNKSVAELQERSKEVMEWVLKVTNEVVLPAMALYQVLHIRKDQDGRPLSAAISYSSCDSQSDRSSSAGLLSPARPVTGSLTGMVCLNPADSPQDQASFLGSAHPYVPQGVLRMISERFHPLLIGGQGSRPQGRLLGSRPPMLDSDRPMEKDILATASLTVAEILLKVQAVMDKQEHDAEDKLSACVEELYESVMGEVLEKFALHHPGCLLSDCHVTSISKDLIYNAWQDAKEKIQVLANGHTDAINELVSPWPPSSAVTRERMEMASFLTGSVADAKEMEKAMAPPSRVTSPTLCSLKESLSGILARHTLFQSPGVVPTEEKLELVRMVGGFFWEMEPTEGGSSLDQPQEAYEASLVQSVATACNVIHNVLKNFHAAQQLIGQVEVADFLQPGSKTFTMVVECVSQSLLGDVAVELDALRRSLRASSNSGRSSRNQECLPLDTQQERSVECSSASKEEQEEEDPQKKEETAPPSARSTSAWSETSSAASCQDLSLIAENMLDIIMRMAHLASRSSPDDSDKRHGGSSVKSFDQAEYDLGRLLASHSMCTRMFQGRIQHFSEQLIDCIYQLLLDTRMGRRPSTPYCRSEPNFQNLEDKERLDQELFTPLLYNFFQTAFKSLMGNLLGEEDLTDDHRADSCTDASSDGSDIGSDSSSDSSDCPSLDWSRGMTPGPRQGVEGRRRSQSRLKPSCSQDQRRALEAICEVLTTQAGSDLYKTCDDPQENMVVVRKAMARVGNLASSSSEDQEVTTGSLDPESGLTSQEVGQPEMDDNENADYPDDFHEEEEGSDCQTIAEGALIEEEEKDEDDGAAGVPEEVQDHPSLPVSPSETPSLQPGEVLIQEKVLMPPRPSALHHQTLHDLLHRLVGRLALQGPLRSCFTPTNSEIESVLLQDVSWFLWNQAGIGLVLEHKPQNPLFSGADALDAMFEATYAELMLGSDSNRAQVHSALQGGAGIVCMAETVATVICHHAEFWSPSAVSGESHDLETGCEEKESTEDSAGLEKASGRSSPFISNTSLDEGLEMDAAGLEKAGRNSTTFITNTSLEEGLEMESAGLEKAGGNSSPFLSNTSLDEGLEMDTAGLEKAGRNSTTFITNTSLDEGLEMESAGLFQASRLASCLSSSSTSRSCYSSSSSTSVLSSPSSSKSSTSSFTSRGSMAQAPKPEGQVLGETDTPIQRWFTLKKEKTFLKDGQNVAAKGKKTSKLFKTNKVSPLSAERPDLGESSIAGGEEKKKKNKSIKAFFRGISAALSRAFCFGCVKDIHQ